MCNASYMTPLPGRELAGSLVASVGAVNAADCLYQCCATAGCDGYVFYLPLSSALPRDVSERCLFLSGVQSMVRRDIGDN